MSDDEEVAEALGRAVARFAERLLDRGVNLEPPVQPDRLLKPSEAAERLGRSRSWFYNHRDSPFLVTLPGGALMVNERALQAWIEENTGPRHD